MLDPFDDIRARDLLLFERVATLGSITAAAKELGLAKPTASRWLAELERRVGQPLVRRTTRHVALNERGQAFLERTRDVLAAFAAARLVAHANEPGGTLRVSVPIPLGRLLAGGVIARFRADLPGVRLEVRLQNERVDLVRDHFDLLIRGGPLPDSDLIARRLATVPMWLYASARFRDTPLDQLNVIAAPGDAALMQRTRPKLSAPVVLVDDRAAVAEALCAGAGVGALPGFLGEPSRASGELLRLDDEPLSTTAVHALYLPAQRDDLRLKILIDHIAAGLQSTLSAAAS